MNDLVVTLYFSHLIFSAGSQAREGKQFELKANEIFLCVESFLITPVLLSKSKLCEEAPQH